MLRLKDFVIFGLLSSLIIQCSKGSGSRKDSPQDEHEPAPTPGTVQIVVSTEDGAFSGAFSAASDLTQLMAVPDDVPDLGGSFISVKPGALALDTSFQVRKEADIGANIVSGAAQGNAVEGAGPAVSVKPAVAQNAVGTIAIGIPLPDGVADLSTSIAVAYTTVDAATGASQSGLISSGSLKLAVPAASGALYLMSGRTIVNFETKFFGTFQAIKLKAPLVKDAVVQSTPKAYCDGRDKETDFSNQSQPANDTYTICTKAQFKLVSSRVDGKYKLGANIDLTGETVAPIGSSEEPFVGQFDGAGFTIKGFKFTEGDGSQIYTGLFRVIGSTATVANMTLDGFDVDSGTFTDGIVGALAGVNHGIVTRVFVTGGTVKGSMTVGGLVGKNMGTVRRSSSSANISVHDYGSNVGGLVAVNGEYTIDGYSLLSGTTPVIEDSFATGSVLGEEAGSVGGLVGYNYGFINRSFSASPSVTGGYAGGLIGNFNYANAVVGNSFGAPTSVSGMYVATSFIGSFESYGVTNCYGTSDSTCESPSACEATPPAVATRAELQNSTHAVYVNWNFTDIWHRPSAGKFPSLR